MLQNYIEITYEGQPCYDILLEQDFGRLAERMSRLETANRKLCIVTETNVGPLHAQKLMDVLKPVSRQVDLFTFEAGEERKNLDTVNNVYEFLIEHKYDRNDILVALGGGVVGDLTGYCAATYMRGIRFVQVPTSLLAMVDSSIGGKTGVDFKAYKNMVGAFYMPQFVYMNISLLSTLPRREYFSGYGEIIKHGLIRDAELYAWLKENIVPLSNLNPEQLTEVIYRSLLVKRDVVQRDPKEKGERALLNFGHTIGHAIEKLKNFSLLHGECVALGMAAAAWLSWQRRMITEAELKELLALLQDFQLPIHTCGLKVDDILLVASSDKKMDAGKIKFILLDKIGSAVIDTGVTQQEMAEASAFLL